MPRILVRGAKAPWVSVPAESVMIQNVLATNSGNLLFGQAVFRSLSIEGTEVIADGYNTTRRGVDDNFIRRINQEFDKFVVPLANAFRPSFQPNLAYLTQVIEGLDMPVTVVGVGTQQPFDAAGDQNSKLDEVATKFMRAVLERSASVGVRGEATASYLKRLGFGDEHTDIIGCPSVFMHGPKPLVRPLGDCFSQIDSLAMSASPETPVMVPMIQAHAERFQRFRYIPQNSWDLNTMMWSEVRDRPDAIDHLVAPESRLHVNDQIRFPLDPNTWVNYLRSFDFMLGTRIHGTIAGILAGTPSLLLAHDSRTRELADYHGIPYLSFDKITGDTRAEDLYQYADYGKFHDRLPSTFDRFTKFLAKNDLPNIYQPGQQINDYDEKLSKATLPRNVHPILAAGPAGRREVASRLWWLKQGNRSDYNRSEYAYQSDVPHTKHPLITAESVNQRLTNELLPLRDQLLKSDVRLTKAQRLLDRHRNQLADARKQLIETQSQLAATRKLVDAQSKVIKKLDVPMSFRVKRYVKRLVARTEKNPD